MPYPPRNPRASHHAPADFASMPLASDGHLENLLVVTSPGVTITGRVVFEHGPAEQPPNQPAQPIRVTAMVGNPMDNMGMGIPMPPPAIAAPDLTFTMKGLSGELLLRANAPLQFLKSVMVNG